jgi:ubiquinone/menaquinone biosynthesis C-methylase UbiE
VTGQPYRQTRAAYEATAERYLERWRHVDPLLDARRRFVRMLQPGSRVLDVGCGPGRDLQWFSEQGLTVAGLDVTHAMLMLCPAQLPRIQADALALPFGTSSFDGWWAAASLLHLRRDDFSQALVELRRVTHLRGVGFVSLKRGHGELLEPVDGGPHQRYFCYWDGDDLDRALVAAGWDVVDSWDTADVRGREPWLNRLVEVAR